MPLLRLQDLPSLNQAVSQGLRVCEQVPKQATRLNIGLLNMMPDRALAATERQFLRLLDSHERRCCAVSLFTIDGIPREDMGREHLRQYYQDSTQISDTDLDALVITGANVTEPDLTNEPFWDRLATVLQQADHRQLPVICSCLAAHAAVLIFHGIARQHLPRKCWGIFEHEVCDPTHPLVVRLPSRFEMPHSRFNEIPKKDLLSHGVRILITSPQAGVQMALDTDGHRIYFQGHPEYETISLLKEYKREVLRYLAGEREDYPPLPNNTFNGSATGMAETFRERALAERDERLIGEFPAEALANEMRQPWQEISRQLFYNWLESMGISK